MILFAKRMENIEDHLSRHSCADIFLDTFNYNAHSTAIDSLWAGLPVITLLGKTYSSRACASYLNTLGFPSIITHSLIEYEQKVIDFSHTPNKLSKLRKTLNERKMSSHLFNSEEITTNLENIYRDVINNIF